MPACHQHPALRFSGSGRAETHVSIQLTNTFVQSLVEKWRREQIALFTDADCEAGGFPNFMGSILLDPPENPSLIPANCYNPLTGQRVGQLFVTLGTLSDSPMGNCVEK